jgi:predicted membrane protein
MAPGVPPDLQKKVDLWFILSIVSIFCGCGILGIIPILLANGAKDALRQGDLAKAEKDIGTAKLLCILGYSLIGLVVIAYALMFFAGFASWWIRRI